MTTEIQSTAPSLSLSLDLIVSFFFLLLLAITITDMPQHASSLRDADLLQSQSHDLTRIASILLSPQFPHSRQVFSFALVHVERAPSVDHSSVISGIAA